MTIEETILARLTAELSNARYDGKTQEEGFALLNATTEIQKVAKPNEFTIDGMLALLSEESAAKLVDWPQLEQLIAKFEAQDVVAVVKWIVFITGTKITKAERDAAIAYITNRGATVVDEVVPIQARVWNVIRAIPGGPNYVTEEQFSAAWLAAGRD